MKKNLNYKFKIGDILAVCLVFLLAITIFFAYFIGNERVEDAKVQIYHNNELIKEFPLNSIDEITYTIEGTYTNIIVIRNGEVFIEYSDCPGEDCVHSGSIFKSGRSIACLPNMVEVRITGSSDTDFVVG